MMVNEEDFTEFIKKMRCSISSDSNKIVGDEIPSIMIHIIYSGKKSIQIPWDDDFGRVLWDGRFVLVSNSDSGKNDSSELRFKTSNTYPPTKTVELNKGSYITSVLDFTQLPASYVKDDMIQGKKFDLELFVKSKDEGKPLKSVSDKLAFIKE